MSLRLGTTDAIVVSSAAAARDVLQRYDNVLAARSVTDAGRALGNHERSVIWLPATSQLWKRLRAVCTNHLFSARGLEATRATREEAVRQLVSCLGRRTGETLEVGRVVFSCVLNLVSGALFSEDVAGLSSDRARELETLVRDTVEEATKPNLSDLFPVLARLDLQGRRRRSAEFIGRFYDFFDPIIARRVKARGSGEHVGDDFLDVLLQLHSMDQLSLQTVKSFLLVRFYPPVHWTQPRAHASIVYFEPSKIYGSLRRRNGHEHDRGGVDDGRAAPAPGRDVQGPRGAAGRAGLQAVPGRVGRRQAALSPRRGDGEHATPPAEPNAGAAPGHGRRRGGGRLHGARRHQGDHKPMGDHARPGVVGGARGVRA
uniref:Cytochrome P450 superfamily protein n=1 Tax=Zea mays TaxID=4577 RepID=A0A804QC53_MAIZE